MRRTETSTTGRDRFIIEVARGVSVTDAAETAGIGRATGFRMMDRDDVRAEVEQLRIDIRRSTVDLLAAASTDAVDVLVSISHDRDAQPAARVSAARTILSEARTYIEVEELRQRVDAIEQGVSGAADLRLMVRSVLAEGGAA